MREGRIHHDAPITGRGEDLLGRAAVADGIAGLITGDLGHGCLTIGVSGPRGSGKTSVINMVRERLREREDIFLLEFDPVSYQHGSKDVTKAFFDSISSELKDLSKDSPELKHQGLGYGAIAKDALKAVDKTIKTKVCSDISKLTGSAMDSEDNTVADTRKKISEQLTKSGFGLVVVIDGLDLLTSEELAQVLRLIGSTARFDNTFYILGYDEETVEKLASKDAGLWDLRQSVQMAVRVPDPEAEAVRNVLRSEIASMIDKSKLDPCGRIWQACEAVSPRNLRELYRMLNCLTLRMSSCSSGTPFGDLVALAYLETAYPEIYDLVVGGRRNARLAERFKGADERAMKAVRFLFPSSENRRHPPNSERRGRRECSGRLL